MDVNNNDTVTLNEFLDRLELLLSKMNDIERQISQKADEVVMVQVLQHRNELDELEMRMESIEKKLEQISEIDESQIDVIENYQMDRQPFLRRIVSIFTL